MMVEQARKRLQLMHEFKAWAIQYADAKAELLDLKSHAERDWNIMHYNHTAVEQAGTAIVQRLAEARENLAKRLQEASYIAAQCGMFCQLKIGAPAGGRYEYTMPVFKAFIEPELPYEFELPSYKVLDVIDQTIFACERDLDCALDFEANPPSVFYRLGAVLAAVFKTLFKTDKERAAARWTLIGMLIIFTLRYGLGVPFDTLSKALVEWVK